jgi:glycolate oxidase FAD binding subunit
VPDDSLSIDGSEPLPVRRPASVAELCGLVKDAASSVRGVYPVGGRTMLDVGLPPLKPGFAVDTTAMNSVIDYPARDMTVTVQAGITIAKLQETLAAEGQWLPVDVPQPERATLGGAVALNVSGPRRFGYGTLRDYVIGISFVTDEGQEVKAGGRVVKNVAGYDLMKVQIGAVGTLGVITQLTLKVKPRPEALASVVFGCDTAALGAVLDLLHASNSRPVVVELLNQSAWRAAGVNPPVSFDWVLAAGFAEKSATVKWQVSTLLADLKAASVRDVSEVCGPEVAALWQSLTELQVRPESPCIFKLNVPPSKVVEAVRGVTTEVPYLVHAEALNGIVWAHLPESIRLGEKAPPEPEVEKRITAEGGNYTLRRCPVAWKRQMNVWGRPGGDRELMRHLKRTLDPGNVFNPGRLFGDV